MNKVYEVIKRIIDIIGAVLGILLMVLIIFPLVILKKVFKDDSPLFFVQERVGKNKTPFKMYKFSSMVKDADKKLEKYLKENKEKNEEYLVNKKLKDDPRITKIGKFIRKTSIDELPQCINVLKGEMSLVGPRPMLYKELEDVEECYKDIFLLKPGITGWWQVNGRSTTTFERRLELDKEYFEKRNLLFDIKILLITLVKVIEKDGAL